MSQYRGCEYMDYVAAVLKGDPKGGYIHELLQVHQA